MFIGVCLSKPQLDIRREQIIKDDYIIQEHNNAYYVGKVISSNAFMYSTLDEVAHEVFNYVLPSYYFNPSLIKILT